MLLISINLTIHITALIARRSDHFFIFAINNGLETVWEKGEILASLGKILIIERYGVALVWFLGKIITDKRRADKNSSVRYCVKPNY